jgi:hypothetical protein
VEIQESTRDGSPGGKLDHVEIIGNPKLPRTDKCASVLPVFLVMPTTCIQVTQQGVTLTIVGPAQ